MQGGRRRGSLGEDERSDLQRLRRENLQLKMERDILKSQSTHPRKRINIRRTKDLGRTKDQERTKHQARRTKDSRQNSICALSRNSRAVSTCVGAGQVAPNVEL